MASGFIVLGDGRCFARRWLFYDDVIRAIASELEDPLHGWLLSLLPTAEDEQHLGYGPWFRKSDQQIIDRFLDLREVTPKNQQLFYRAVRKANDKALTISDAALKRCLADLADMVDRSEKGEPPLSCSDWTVVVPFEGKRIGPGW